MSDFWITLARKLLPWLFSWLKSLGVAQGRAEVRQEQREAADALREDYDAFNEDGRSLDDALSRLRMRDRPLDGGGLP